jgi:hypothetical protein
MTDFRGIDRRLSEILDLQRRPVAVTFRKTAPDGVPKFTGTEPSKIRGIDWTCAAVLLKA